MRVRVFYSWFFALLWGLLAQASSLAQAQQQDNADDNKQDIVLFGVDLEAPGFNQDLRTVDAYKKDQAYIGGGGGTQQAEVGKGNFIITYRKGDFQTIDGKISEYRGQAFGFKKKEGNNLQGHNKLFGNEPVKNQVYSISLFPYELAKNLTNNNGKEPTPTGFFVSRGQNGNSGGNGIGKKSYIFHFWDRYKKGDDNTGIVLDIDNRNESDDNINAVLAVDTNKVLAVGSVLKVFDGRKNKWKNYIDSAKDKATKTSKIKQGWELNAIATLHKKPGEPDTAYIVGKKGVFIRVPFQVVLKNGQQQPPKEDSIKIDTLHIKNNCYKNCQNNNNCNNCNTCPDQPEVGKGLPCNGNGDTNLVSVAVVRDTVWVTSDKGTIYKSTDTGKTFKKEDLPKGKVLAYTSQTNGGGTADQRKEVEVDPAGQSFNTISFPLSTGGYAAGQPKDNKTPQIYEYVCDPNRKIPRNVLCCDPQKSVPPIANKDCKWQPSAALANRYDAQSYPTWYGASFITPDLGWLVGSSGALIRYAPDFDMSCGLNDLTALQNAGGDDFDWKEQGGPKKTKLPANQYYGGEREVSLINLGTAEVAVCAQTEEPAIPILVDKVESYEEDQVPDKLRNCCGQQKPDFGYTSDPKKCRQQTEEQQDPQNQQPANLCERTAPAKLIPPTYVRVHNFGRALVGTEWELTNRPPNMYFFLPRAGVTVTQQNVVRANQGANNQRNDLTKDFRLSPSYDPLHPEKNELKNKFSTDTEHIRIRTKINPKIQHALCYDSISKVNYEKRTKKDTAYPLAQMKENGKFIPVSAQNGTAGNTQGQTNNNKEELPDTVRGVFWGRNAKANQGKRFPYTIGVGALAPNFSLSPLITPMVFVLGRSRTIFDTLFIVQPGLKPYLHPDVRQGDNNNSFGNQSKYYRVHSNAYPNMEDSFHITTNAAYKVYMKNAPVAYDLDIDKIPQKIDDTPILRRYNKYREGTFNRPTLNIKGKWLYTNSAQTSMDTIVLRGIGPCIDPKMESNSNNGQQNTNYNGNHNGVKVDDNGCYNDSTFLVLKRDPLYYKITPKGGEAFTHNQIKDTNDKDYNQPAVRIKHLLFEANGKPKQNIFELETDTRYGFKLGGGYQKLPEGQNNNSHTPKYDKEDYHKGRFHLRLYKKDGTKDEDTLKPKNNQHNPALDSIDIAKYDTGGKNCPETATADQAQGQAQQTQGGNGDQLFNGITPMNVQLLLRKSNYWDKKRLDTITYEVTGYHNPKQPTGSNQKKRRFAAIIVEQEAAQLFLLRKGTASEDNLGFDPSVPEGSDEKVDLYYYQDSLAQKRFNRDSVYIKSNVKWHIKTGRQQNPSSPSNDAYGKGFGVWWDTISVPPMAIYKRGSYHATSGGTNHDSIPQYKGDGLKDIPEGVQTDTIGNAVWTVNPNGTGQEHKEFPRIVFRVIQSNMTDQVREDSIQICALEDFVCKTVKIRQDTPHISYTYENNSLRTRMTKDTALYFVHKKYDEKYKDFTKDSIRIKLLNGGMWAIDTMGCYNWQDQFTPKRTQPPVMLSSSGTTSTTTATTTTQNSKDSIPLFSKPPGTQNGQNPQTEFTYKKGDDNQYVVTFWTPLDNMTNHRRRCSDSVCAVAPEIQEAINSNQGKDDKLHKPIAPRKNQKNKYCLPLRFVQDTPLIVVDQEPALFDYYIGARGSFRIGANENFQLILPDFVKLVSCNTPQGQPARPLTPVPPVDQATINPNVLPVSATGAGSVCCKVNAQQQPPQPNPDDICNNSNSQPQSQPQPQPQAQQSSSTSLDNTTCQTQVASELVYDPITNCLKENAGVATSNSGGGSSGSNSGGSSGSGSSNGNDGRAKHDFKETQMRHQPQGILGIETRQYCFEVRRLYDDAKVNKEWGLKIFIPKTHDSVKRTAKMVQQPPLFDPVVAGVNAGSSADGIAGSANANGSNTGAGNANINSVSSNKKQVFLPRRAGEGVGLIKLHTNTKWQVSNYDATLFEFDPSQSIGRRDVEISLRAKQDNELENAIYDTALFYPTDVCQTRRNLFRDTIFIKQDSFWIHVVLRKDKDPKYPQIEQINQFPLYIIPSQENDYLRFDVEANAPWIATNYKGGNATEAWNIIKPDPSGYSPDDKGLLALNAFALPDFLVGRQDSIQLSLISKSGFRNYRHTIHYYQKPYDFKEGNIIVFPNPVKSRLYIKSINSTLFKSGSIFIYALDGSLIAARTYANGIIDFDFDTLPQGVYILKIFDGKVFVTKKIIKG